jgi:1-acyl-sn-glycerol-3-phosphate acyltransferase
MTRTGSRAARVGAFAIETWSRLLVDGIPTAIDERVRELAWVAENLCALHGVRAQVSGKRPRGVSVLVANHVSYFDPMVIASAVPCTAIAKHEVASWPCVGELCKRLGVLFVQRDNAQQSARTLREMQRLLEAGISVLVFPEGTTTRGDSVLAFKRGVFGVAALAGVPIVPIALRYEGTHAPWVGDDTFFPHYVRTMAKPYTRVALEFLPALAHTQGASAEELAAQARAAISASLARSASCHDYVSSFADGCSLATA